MTTDTTNTMLASLRTAQSDLAKSGKQLDETITRLEGELAAARAERAALDAAAPKIVEAIEALQPPPKKRASTNGAAKTKSSTSGAAKKKSSPKVTPDRVVKALQGLDGPVDSNALTAALGLSDGRSLAGARTAASGDPRYDYTDGTWSLTAKAEPQAAAKAKPKVKKPAEKS